MGRHEPEPAFDARSSRLDITRIRALLDYSPRDFARGLAAGVAHNQSARSSRDGSCVLVNR